MSSDQSDSQRVAELERAIRAIGRDPDWLIEETADPFLCRSCGATSKEREPCLNHEGGRFPIMVPRNMKGDSLQSEYDALKELEAEKPRYAPMPSCPRCGTTMRAISNERGYDYCPKCEGGK